MRVQFLGAGTIVPTLKRSYSSILVETSHEKFLVDIGPATLYKLYRSGTNIEEIDQMLLSHFHVDHVADYLPLIHTKAFNPETGEMQPKGTLTIYGPRGLSQFTRDLLENVSPWKSVADSLGCSGYLSLHEVTEGVFKNGSGWVGAATPVQHAGGVAYRIESEGRSLTYSGDTVPDENLIRLAKQTDLLIHECSFPNEDLLVGLHTSASKLGEIAAKTDCGRLAITHLYPVCEEKIDEMIETIQRDYDGEVVVAEDYMVIDV
ncbi:MBL fold metallo-hydrolase [Candidatus Bathyarchaeota archaeon]|nr:MBL fold metallo-hydrolase [Candidatus Bathyarchaeota archaeon]